MDINKNSLDHIAGLLGDLDGKSENEMIAELAQLIKTGQGGITPNKAKQMIQTIMPMMDAAQRRKLEKLLRAL